MSIALKRNGAEAFVKIVSRYTHYSQFINLIQDKEKSIQFYKELGWLESGNYFANAAADILSDFITTQASLFEKYINLEIPLSIVCRELISYISKKNMSLDKEAVYACLIHYDCIVDNAIKNNILNGSYRKHINILGFGLRNGYYEREIKELLLNKKLIESATIYGFDPDPSEVASDIKMLLPNTLSSKDCPKFDLVLIKWVLHHIHYEKRWSELINCLNQCRPNAKIIIVEEGCFPDKSYDKLPVLLYEFLLGCADVIINIALHPNWFKAISTDVGEPFFLSYLSSTDIQVIEDNFQFPFERSVQEIWQAFFNQTLITYKVLPVLKPNKADFFSREKEEELFSFASN